MNSDVEEVKSRTNIADLIGEYIRLQKAGSNWRALCPFHNEKTPSFMVSEERNSWHCFGCGKGGDAFSFVMEMEGIGFREALEQLAQKAGVELKRYEGAKKEGSSVKPKLFNILDLATKWYEKNLWEGKGKDKILKYLRERGLRDETIKKFRLGYAPDGWRNALDFLLKRGYKAEEIARTGILVEKESKGGNQKTAERYYDRFRDRIMFPVQDIMGRVVGFSARVAPGGDEKNAKYINTPQTELYDKSKILYGLYFAKTEIKKKDEAILVEGNMDVIASHQAGFSNAIAVSGTALATEQIKIIKRYSENLKMAFDMDSAGQAAAKKSARICLENDLNVRIVLLPSGKDAADILRENKKIWEKSVAEAREIIGYYFEDVFSRFDPEKPADKKKIAKELLDVVKDVANPIEQSHWLKILAERLGTEEKILADVLGRSRKEKTRKHSEGAEKEEKSEGTTHFLEKRIVGLIMAFPKECRRQMELIDPENFSDSRTREILEDIIKNKESCDMDSVKSRLSDYESAKFLDEAVFEVEAEMETNESGGQKPLDPSEELKLYRERLEKTRLKEKIIKITRNIREAEKSGDGKAVKKLVNEFQNLASRIEL